MTYAPITPQALSAIVDAGVNALPAKLAESWSSVAVPVFTVPVDGAASSDPELVHAVARLGNRILFFDDVEEEFGVGVLDTAGLLSTASLYGELRWALRGLVEHHD